MARIVIHAEIQLNRWRNGVDALDWNCNRTNFNANWNPLVNFSSNLDIGDKLVNRKWNCHVFFDKNQVTTLKTQILLTCPKAWNLMKFFYCHIQISLAYWKCLYLKNTPEDTRTFLEGGSYDSQWWVTFWVFFFFTFYST